MDNSVLRLAVGAFARTIYETCQINPFFEAATLPSLALLIFRKMNLIPETIPLIPYGGYGGHIPHSKVATLWLEFMRQHHYPGLKHAENGGEEEITLENGKSVHVDGFVPDEESKGIVLEFYGCFYHKCPKCYASHRMDRTTGIYAGYTAEYTAAREAEIRKAGYTVISIWECEFHKLIASDPVLAEFVSEHPVLKAMIVREAYFGARTEVFTMYAKVDPTINRRIQYYDVISLYPSVMLKELYPVGLPDDTVLNLRFNSAKLIEFWEANHVFGVVACTVLPPRDLWLPVLPVRSPISGKLLFGLCYSCMLDPPGHASGTTCSHRKEQRQITGTYISEELRLAVSVGYKIVAISEIYHYNAKAPLFASFMETWTAKKIESSGMPEHVHNEEDLALFCSEYLSQLGIEINQEQLHAGKNDALRNIAKLVVNSFYG